MLYFFAEKLCCVYSRSRFLRTVSIILIQGQSSVVSVILKYFFTRACSISGKIMHHLDSKNEEKNSSGDVFKWWLGVRDPKRPFSLFITTLHARNSVPAWVQFLGNCNYVFYSRSQFDSFDIVSNYKNTSGMALIHCLPLSEKNI